MKSTSRYSIVGATLEQEIKVRKELTIYLKAAKFIAGRPAYAAAYGFVDNVGCKKILKCRPVFFDSARFDLYVMRHKQIVLAVYNRSPSRFTGYGKDGFAEYEVDQ